jgi:hypothetical protein
MGMVMVMSDDAVRKDCKDKVSEFEKAGPQKG